MCGGDGTTESRCKDLKKQILEIIHVLCPLFCVLSGVRSSGAGCGLVSLLGLLAKIKV